jgi:hypothetical protein
MNEHLRGRAQHGSFSHVRKPPGGGDVKAHHALSFEEFVGPSYSLFGHCQWPLEARDHLTLYLHCSCATMCVLRDYIDALPLVPGRLPIGMLA